MAKRDKVDTTSKYTPERVEDILARISSGQTVRQACTANGVDRVTVLGWTTRYPAFKHRYARARELQMEVLEDELLEIADDGRNDWIETESKTGNKYVKLNDEAVRRSQIRLDTRWRLLAAHKPERYGRKLDVTSAGKTLNDLGAAMAAAAEGLERESGETENAPHALN